MKAMNALKSAITSKIRVVIGILFGSTFIATHCFAQQTPANVGIIAQGKKVIRHYSLYFRKRISEWCLFKIW